MTTMTYEDHSTVAASMGYSLKPKAVADLTVGDVVVGIEHTVFTEAHAIVSVNPAMVIADNGGAFLRQQMGHHMAMTLVAVQN